MYLGKLWANVCVHYITMHEIALINVVCINEHYKYMVILYILLYSKKDHLALNVVQLYLQ